MKINSEKLIEEFYKRHKNQFFSDLSFEQVKEICLHQWNFVKQEIESGELPSIRLKYIGIFKVHKGRAKNMYDKLDERYDKGSINKKQYDKFKTMLTKFLKDEN